MRVLNETLLENSDASVNLESEQGLLAHVLGYSIQIIITGNPTGSIKLQGSSDPVPDSYMQGPTVFPVTNWADISDSEQPVTGAGTITYNVKEIFYNWVRVIYTASSGSGTITAILNTKGF